MTIKNFEDIEAWQKARVLCNEIYKISETGDFTKDFGLKNQIYNASGSIMDNIAEGFERSGRKEFLQFLAIAKGSSGEVRSQLYIALDRKYINKEKFDSLCLQCFEIGRMINGFMKYLNASEIKGTKYKTEPNLKLETSNLKL